MFKHTGRFLVPSLIVLGLAACGESGGDQARDSSQTKFPGQVVAGGLTSGEVMASQGSLQPKTDAMSSPVLVSAKIPAESTAPARGGAPAPSQQAGDSGAGQMDAEGTPGIPSGAEGNVGGTEMGGTTPDAAATEEGPSGTSGGNAAMEKASKEAEAKAKADREKQQLETAMDRVAQRWQETASARGWQTEPADSSGAAGMNMGQSETSAIGLPTVIRSEKLGTAPPSEDVKNPAEKPSNKAPD